MQVRFKSNSASVVRLVSSPIPTKEIIEGRPYAKIWISTQSADKKITQGVWDCTAGKFSHLYTWDEFVMILEGEATIVPEGGENCVLRSGDFAYFPSGLSASWHVPKYVRKTFVIHSPDPLIL